MDILKEILPKLSRVAVFGTATGVGQALEMKEIERAAAAIGAKVQYVDVLTVKDVDPAFRAAVKGRAEAVIDIISGSSAALN